MNWKSCMLLLVFSKKYEYVMGSEVLLDVGYRTADIMSDGMTQVGCEKCGDLVIENLRRV